MIKVRWREGIIIFIHRRDVHALAHFHAVVQNLLSINVPPEMWRKGSCLEMSKVELFRNKSLINAVLMLALNHELDMIIAVASLLRAEHVT